MKAKYKVGDIVKWTFADSLWAIDEVIEINENDQFYKMKVLASNATNHDNYEGVINNVRFDSSILRNSSELCLEYIKEKEFNKDLKDLIEET